MTLSDGGTICRGLPHRNGRSLGLHLFSRCARHMPIFMCTDAVLPPILFVFLCCSLPLCFANRVRVLLIVLLLFYRSWLLLFAMWSMRCFRRDVPDVTLAVCMLCCLIVYLNRRTRHRTTRTDFRLPSDVAGTCSTLTAFSDGSKPAPCVLSVTRCG